jgi:hypothetical protein
VASDGGRPARPDQKAFFRKLVQLQNLIEKLTCAIAKIGHRRVVSESACESRCLSLADDTSHNISTLLATLEADLQPISERYHTLYRKWVNSLPSKPRSHFQKHAGQIALSEKSVLEAADEIIQAIRHFGQSVETAANALDAQLKRTLREIARVRSLHTAFESSFRPRDQESLEKARLFEEQREKKMNDLRRAH